MKLIDISQSYLSDAPNSMGGIHVHRQNLMLKQQHNWDIQVITPQLQGYRWLKKEAHSYPFYSIRDEISIWRPRYYIHEKPTYLLAWHYRSVDHAIQYATRKIIQSWVPDLIVCDWILPGAIGAARLAQQFDVPLVFKTHGQDVRTLTALQQMGKSIPEIQAAMRQSAAIICNGESLQEQVKQLSWVEPEKVLNVPIGTDLTTFKPLDFAEKQSKRQELGISPVATVILFVGTWIEYKGTAEMAQVIPHILSDYPNTEFIIAGPIKDIKSQQTLQQYEYANRIRFLGSVPPQDISQWMQTADFFLLPSHKEGLPSALLEAMSSGLVAIASDVGSISRVIEHGRNGFLISPQDVIDLQQTLEIALTEQSQYAQRSIEAQATVRNSTYDLASIGEQLNTIYIKAIDSK